MSGKMNWLLYLVMLLFAIAAAQKRCTPGNIVYNKCNACICLRNGYDQACTEDSCSPPTEYEYEPPKQICNPSSIYFYYCNACKCSNDGLSSFCSSDICEEGKWNKDGSLKLREKRSNRQVRSTRRQICEPSSTYSDQCNECLCSQDGLTSYCTLMTCDENLSNDSISLNLARRKREFP